MKKLILILTASVALTACQATHIIVEKPDGDAVLATFYPGNDLTSPNVPDLFIVNGTNYEGKIGYSLSDPLGDLSFRSVDRSIRLKAECIADIVQYGNEKCVEYEVFRSNLDVIPEGSTFKVN